MLLTWKETVLLTTVLFLSFVYQTRGQCSSHQFECANKKCVPLTWRCDEDDDCGDRSDEEHCEIRTCSGTEFKCANEKCVPSRWQCDNEDDCGDKSDEDPHFCGNKTCSPEQFMCKSTDNVCIPVTWRCDGQEDCQDGSDEKDDCHQITCTEEEFSCKNNKCITKRWVCDQDNDCGDGSDELNCPNVTCSSSEFMCTNGKCTPFRWHCDGDIDCADGSDEKDCPDVTMSPCNTKEFTCANRKDCIHLAWQCDGDVDCPDGSDEVNCVTTCRPDQFQCKDHQCIPGPLQCNGLKECRDGSDEENCPDPTKRPCDTKTEFDCGNNHCISLNLVCNGKNDCGEWEDEPRDKCHKDECSVNRGGCSQICIDKPIGYMCGCYEGYELADNKTCQDINECNIPGSCSQICINQKSGYKCECVDGYVLEPNNHHRCKAKEGHPALLFANRHDIRKINLETLEYKAVVMDLRSAVSLDYVYGTKTIIWSDVAEECIKSAPLDTGSPVTKVIDKGISIPDGVAADWIYNHIYWTDTGKDAIGVSDMLGRNRKTLISTGLEEPRAIVVNPLEGWMFWTDWGEPSKIERAGMDGSHRSVIVSSDIKWPNGLAIDLVSQKLFWVDAKLHILSSANYDGSDQRVVLSSIVVFKHPFSIDVFEDWVYWTDWVSESIHRVNKFNGKEVSDIAVGIFSPMDVHVYHAYKQPNGTNYCKALNGMCSHLCLPAPLLTTNSAKYTCACPDSLILSDDKKNCIDRTPVEVPTSTTTVKVPIIPKRTDTKLSSTTTSTVHSVNLTSVPSTTSLPTKVVTHAPEIPTSTTTIKIITDATTSIANSSIPFYASPSPNPSVLGSTTTEPITVSADIEIHNNSTESVPSYSFNITQDYLKKTNPENPETDTGRIAGIIIGVLGGLAIVVTLVAFLIYKQYLRRNVTSMNFDNPVYRKTTEDQFSLEKNQYQPARSYPPSLEPLTSPGTNEFV